MSDHGSSAVEWAQFSLDVVTFLVGTAMTVAMLLFLMMFIRTFWNFYSEGKHELPAIKILLRRVYCRHRLLSRTKTRYGFHKTICSHCGTDVNRNRPTEMRR